MINVLLLLIKQLPLTAISIMINNVDRIVRAAIALNCDALCGYHRVILRIGGHHRFGHLMLLFHKLDQWRLVLAHEIKVVVVSSTRRKLR